MKEKQILEKTILTALVNLKCVGYFGKCLKPFNHKERSRVIDTLINRGWINERCEPTAAAAPIIQANLNLCQY